jgi:hypothetical protein
MAGGSFGGAVRDQAGDRAVCLGVVLAASCPALQGAPLTQFGVCVPSMRSVTFSAEGLVGQTGAQVDQGDQQSVGEHELVSWPSAGLAPPVAAAPGLGSRLPPRRELGDKLAKVFP